MADWLPAMLVCFLLMLVILVSGTPDDQCRFVFKEDMILNVSLSSERGAIVKYDFHAHDRFQCAEECCSAPGDWCSLALYTISDTDKANCFLIQCVPDFSTEDVCVRVHRHNSGMFAVEVAHQELAYFSADSEVQSIADFLRPIVGPQVKSNRALDSKMSQLLFRRVKRSGDLPSSKPSTHSPRSMSAFVPSTAPQSSSTTFPTTISTTPRMTPMSPSQSSSMQTVPLPSNVSPTSQSQPSTTVTTLLATSTSSPPPPSSSSPSSSSQDQLSSSTSSQPLSSLPTSSMTTQSAASTTPPNLHTTSAIPLSSSTLSKSSSSPYGTTTKNTLVDLVTMLSSSASLTRVTSSSTTSPSDATTSLHLSRTKFPSTPLTTLQSTPWVSKLSATSSSNLAPNSMSTPPHPHSSLAASHDMSTAPSNAPSSGGSVTHTGGSSTGNSANEGSLTSSLTSPSTPVDQHSDINQHSTSVPRPSNPLSTQPKLATSVHSSTAANKQVDVTPTESEEGTEKPVTIPSSLSTNGGEQEPTHNGTWPQENTENNGTESSGEVNDNLGHDEDVIYGRETVSQTGILIVTLCFGIIFFLTVTVVVTKRWMDGYRRRKYSKVDYLINGIYS
ncbi:uncharacterized protein [Diadema antillarum]|uniref:uncharacterized protein n=1 Tax=Diadema antillarum TaxID=105358 RepID=UPI003A88CBF8